MFTRQPVKLLVSRISVGRNSALLCNKDYKPRAWWKDSGYITIRVCQISHFVYGDDLSWQILKITYVWEKRIQACFECTRAIWCLYLRSIAHTRDKFDIPANCKSVLAIFHSFSRSMREIISLSDWDCPKWWLDRIYERSKTSWLILKMIRAEDFLQVTCFCYCLDFIFYFWTPPFHQ